MERLHIVRATIPHKLGPETKHRKVRYVFQKRIVIGIVSAVARVDIAILGARN